MQRREERIWRRIESCYIRFSPLRNDVSLPLNDGFNGSEVVLPHSYNRSHTRNVANTIELRYTVWFRDDGQPCTMLGHCLKEKILGAGRVVNICLDDVAREGYHSYWWHP